MTNDNDELTARAQFHRLEGQLIELLDRGTAKERRELLGLALEGIFEALRQGRNEIEALEEVGDKVRNKLKG